MILRMGPPWVVVPLLTLFLLLLLLLPPAPGVHAHFHFRRFVVQGGGNAPLRQHDALTLLRQHSSSLSSSSSSWWRRLDTNRNLILRKPHGTRSNAVVLTSTESIVMPTTNAPLETTGKKEDEKDDVLQTQPKPSFYQMKQQLGPISWTLVSALEVVLQTTMSYVSSAITGYVLGMAIGTPTLLFGKAPPPLLQDTARKWSDSIKAKVGQWHSNSATMSRNLGQFSASFAFFGTLLRVLRFDTQDEWNHIGGSALAGAYRSKSRGSQAMMANALVYASIDLAAFHLLRRGAPTTTTTRENEEEQEGWKEGGDQPNFILGNKGVN